MKMLVTLFSVSASFLLLAVMFIPLERAFPADPKQKLLRPEWLTDLAYFLGQYLLWGWVVLVVLHNCRGLVNAVAPRALTESVAAQPWLLQALVVILLGDLSVYWFHRLQHSSEFLWTFHSTHHSAEHLDWLAAHREHPLDGMATQLVVNLPAFILGFPLSTLAGLIVFRGVWAVFIHANVRLSLGPAKWILGSPELHHWHHAKEGECCNFANISPIMDLLFGTYCSPETEPTELGLSGEYPRGYFAQLCYPFQRRTPKPNNQSTRASEIVD